LRLHEYQAKELFIKQGISVPKGIVARSPKEVQRIVEQFEKPVVLKAQVLVGGRGIAGGIKFAKSPYEAKQVADSLFNSKIKGKKIRYILIEEKISIKKEYYLSVTYDYKEKNLIVMTSSRGGVDIEKVSYEHPEDIIQEKISNKLGLTDFQCKRIAKKTGIEGRGINSFANIIKKTYEILLKYDATLVEINPLVLTENNSFEALDAKILLDEGSSFRHHDFYKKIESQKTESLEGYEYRKAMAEKAGIPTYIELQGNIAIIADGAGTGMLTFDLTKEYGGDIGTYCELGGKANPELMARALEISSDNKSIDVILVNLIGGLNKMNEMSDGIMRFINKLKVSNSPLITRIIVRMSGTLEKEGREILKKAGMNAYDNIYDAIEKSIKTARV
jgi:succinyl-CoA synthetase beta subunit